MLSDSSGDFDQIGTGGNLLDDGLAARGDGELSSLGEHGHNVDDIIHSIPTIWTTHEVVFVALYGAVRGSVGGVAVKALEGTSIPVDNLVLGDILVDGCILVLVGSNVGLGEIEPAVVGPIEVSSFLNSWGHLYAHVVSPLGVTIVIVKRAQGTDVVGLTIVVPCDNLNHRESFLQDLIPAIENQGTTREDPVLAVTDLLEYKLATAPGRTNEFNIYRSVVRKEPG